MKDASGSAGSVRIRSSRRGAKRAAASRIAEPDNFSDKRLLLDLCSSCVPLQQAAAATDTLLRAYGTIAEAVAAPEAELAALDGVGTKVADLLRCLRSVTDHLASRSIRHRDVLRDRATLESYLMSTMARSRNELARVIFLDSKNQVIADEVMWEGTVNHVPLYPREVIRRAILMDATAFIVVHNHPSGDPSPSRADVELTRELVAAAATVGMLVLDHIIVGRSGCQSFKQLGLM